MRLLRSYVVSVYSKDDYHRAPYHPRLYIMFKFTSGKGSVRRLKDDIVAYTKLLAQDFCTRPSIFAGLDPAVLSAICLLP